ncbi:MAG: arginase family protein [Candidatus Nanopelagicales bacterium]
MRYGAQFGPDITFLGVDPADLDDPDTYRDADVVILGAPFDGGTSYRSGARFGPKALRETCYLAHDGSRPSLAMRVDGLQDLRVVDVGDVEMFSGDAARSCADLEAAVEKVAATGAMPLDPGRRPHRDLAGCDGSGPRWGQVGQGQRHPLRRPR